MATKRLSDVETPKLIQLEEDHPCIWIHGCSIILMETKLERAILGSSSTDGQWNDR